MFSIFANYITVKKIETIENILLKDKKREKEAPSSLNFADKESIVAQMEKYNILDKQT